MKRQLIITADDYGMCEPVNQAIEACMANGVVRATCVMANMPAFDAAAGLRQKFPHCSLGIHWTVTQGCPVLPQDKVPTLVGRNGEFHSPSDFRRLWLLGQIEKSELQAELIAQYTRCCHAIGHPDFWNTHQNFHVYPKVFDVCVETALKLGIGAMRSHRRVTLPVHQSPAEYYMRHPLYWLKGFGIAWWARNAELRGAIMPDGLFYMPDAAPNLSSLEASVQRVAWQKIDKALEFVIHPSAVVDTRLFRRNAARRVHEYQVFADPHARTRLKELGVQLVGFEVLREASCVPAFSSVN